MKNLLHGAFEALHANTVELNVFDWNTAAIKCYEKAGFIINRTKTALFETGDKKWTALNMMLEKR